MIISIYRTLGITLHTVRADYDCVVTFFYSYQVLNRTIRSAALPYPKHGCRHMPAPMRSSCNCVSSFLSLSRMKLNSDILCPALALQSHHGIRHVRPAVRLLQIASVSEATNIRVSGPSLPFSRITKQQRCFTLNQTQFQGGCIVILKSTLNKPKRNA